MKRRRLGYISAPTILCIGLGAGCSHEGQATTEQKVHVSYTKEQLNAPLSPQAKARGAQVAPPPTR